MPADDMAVPVNASVLSLSADGDAGLSPKCRSGAAKVVDACSSVHTITCVQEAK